MNLFSRAVETLRRAAEMSGSPIAIVGGLAAIHHQAAVVTVDIDIVVARDRLDEVMANCERVGLDRDEAVSSWLA